MDDCNIPEPEHPVKRERRCDVASLFVMKAEWPNLKAICVAHGATLIGVKHLPVINAFDVDVLCPNADRTMGLHLAWFDYSKTSPHRPRSWED